MTRFVAAWLGLAIGLTGCGAASNSVAANPTPTATPYVSTDGGFSAVFPGTPQKQTQNVNQSGVSLVTTIYLVTTNDEQVAVAYTTLPVAPTGDAINAGLDGAVNGSASNVGGQVVSRSNTTYLGAPAEDAVVQAQGSVVHERIVFIGRKLFILEGVTNSIDAKHPAYDKLLASFKTTS